jgi:hypothetical protein
MRRRCCLLRTHDGPAWPGTGGAAAGRVGGAAAHRESWQKRPWKNGAARRSPKRQQVSAQRRRRHAVLDGSGPEKRATSELDWAGVEAAQRGDSPARPGRDVVRPGSSSASESGAQRGRTGVATNSGEDKAPACRTAQKGEDGVRGRRRHPRRRKIVA